ncbi:hypothetical protein [Sphaerisporangium sp. NPDC051011]|uniref:hypothetical protein n=1 Tax=Sphaerisporangium sp. NPDC051011 TaxID=3155792 RepID=UPI0033CB6463
MPQRGRASRRHTARHPRVARDIVPRAVRRMRGEFARFRARGVLFAAELDERARDFLAGT